MFQGTRGTDSTIQKNQTVGCRRMKFEMISDPTEHYNSYGGKFSTQTKVHTKFAKRPKNLPNRNRTSDRWMTHETMHVPLQSTALPTELSGVNSLSVEVHNVPSVGIEPTTLGLLDPRSNQLSYEGMPLCYVGYQPILIFPA